MAAASDREQRLEAMVERLQERERAMRASRFWQLRDAYTELKRRLGFITRDPLAPLSQDGPPPATALEEHAAYALWVERHAIRDEDLARMRAFLDLMPQTPEIAVLVPAADAHPPHLDATIRSVLAQVYPHWRLHLALDDSSDLEIVRVLDRFDDGRISIVPVGRSAGMAPVCSELLAAATSAFVGFLGSGDLLAPHALFEFVFAIARFPATDIVYSDEDKIDDAGHRFDPYFKPQWSPESLLSRMYAGRFTAYRRSLLEAVGGVRSAFVDALDYDLLLRASENARLVTHVPSMLYHRRSAASWTTTMPDASPRQVDAGARALRDALDRRGEPFAGVEALAGYPGAYRVRFTVQRPAAVTIVIPTRDKSDVLERAIDSIVHLSTYDDYRLLIVDNGSIEAATLATFERYERELGARFQRLRDDRPFNFSQLNNMAVSECRSPFVILLNNDTEVVTPDWIEALVEYGQRPEIGAVGPQLLYPDGRVQHAGVIIGIGGVAGHAHKYFDPESAGYFASLQATTNYSAVTAACLLVRREVYEGVGGLDERLPVAFNDVDFCLRILEAGFRNVYVPHARLIHHESATRGYDMSPEQRAREEQEVVALRKRWEIGVKSDPYYSPWLSREHEDFRLAD